MANEIISKIYVDYLDESQPEATLKIEGSTQMGNLTEKIKSATLELTDDIIEVISESIGALCKNFHTGAFKQFENNPPTKFSIEFGIEITGGTSIKIVEASVGSQIKISAEWDTN